MERLKGKTILVGKEPGQGRLLVQITGIGQTVAIGAVGSVPNGVSRLMNGTAHCSLTMEQDGNVTVSNLKPENVTYANGATIVKKKMSANDSIELGKDHYKVVISMILQAAEKLLLPPPAKEYSIKHLEQIWKKYHDGTIAIKKRGMELGASQSFTPILTLGSTAVSAVAAPLNLGMYIWPVTLPLILVGVFLMVRNYQRRKNDTSIEDSERLLEELQQKYVCPNPDCKHFMGNQPYSIIRQNKSCPWCKCKYNEK